MNKKNLILGAILVGLIIIAFLYQGPLKTWKENLGKPDNFLSELNFDEINRIEIDKNKGVIAFVKVNDKWKIDGTKDFWLSDTQSSQIVSALTDAKNSNLELSSENPEKKKDFQTDEQGQKIKLMNGNETKYEFIIGKVASDFQSTYIAKIDSDKTYLFKASLNSAFNQGSWYDKTIFSEESEKITSVRFQYPDRAFTIELEGEGDETVWKGTKPYRFSVKKEKIQGILDIMANLNAKEVPVQNFEGTGLEKNLIIVQATGNDGFDNTIMIGDAQIIEIDDMNKEESKLYYAKKATSDNIYLIDEETRNELDKWIWQLR